MSEIRAKVVSVELEISISDYKIQRILFPP